MFFATRVAGENLRPRDGRGGGRSLGAPDNTAVSLGVGGWIRLALLDLW